MLCGGVSEMEDCAKRGDDCPQLLDLIPKDREWLLKRDKNGRLGSSKEEIKSLELKLGPPGEENSRERDDYTLSLGYSSNMTTHFSSVPKRGFAGEKGWGVGFNENQQQQRNGSYLQMQSNPQILPVMGKESSQPCSTRMVELLQSGAAEKKNGFSAAATAANTAVPNCSQKRKGIKMTCKNCGGVGHNKRSCKKNGQQPQTETDKDNATSSQAPRKGRGKGKKGKTLKATSNAAHVVGEQNARPNAAMNAPVLAEQALVDAPAALVSQATSNAPTVVVSEVTSNAPLDFGKMGEGTAPTSVVGWPPVRSFRKNLAGSSSSKQTTESQNAVQSKVPSEKPLAASCKKGFFVKINMEGVPIGRKVDLEAYNSYEKLASSVDELFRGLLAAQRDSSACGMDNNQEGEKSITGLLGDYTLVYEDNEGDMILVGDVPWHMFVSSVKRLRVLKSSELSTLCLSSKREKIPLSDASR